MARIKALVLLWLLVVVGSCIPQTLLAQSGDDGSSKVDGVTVSPPLKELVLGPGLVEAHTNVTVTNSTGQEVVATVRLVDFKALDEFGGVSLGEAGVGSGKYGLANWISLPDGDTYKIQDGKSATIQLSIANTDDLPPGGHYGAAIISISDPINNGGNSIALKREVASLIFVKKLGGEVYGLEFESLKPDKTGAAPESVTLKFRATGNVHVVPRGYVEVKDPNGKLISKGIINPESTLVLPESSRQYVTLMQPVATSSVWGRYTITAYYRHDNQENFDTHTVYFNKGLSKSAILVGIILVASVVLFLVTFIRKFKRHRKRNRLPSGKKP